MVLVSLSSVISFPIYRRRHSALGNDDEKGQVVATKQVADPKVAWQ